MKTGKETGLFREQWTYFKKGKNEINFMMNVYQTLILLFSMSVMGDLPLTKLLGLTAVFVVSFFVIANRIGNYTTKKVDPSGKFVSIYAQDENKFRVQLCRGLIHMSKGNSEQAINHFRNAEKISLWWIKEETPSRVKL